MRTTFLSTFWLWGMALSIGLGIGAWNRSPARGETGCMSNRSEMDLVPISQVAPSIDVDLKLAGVDHPFGRAFYRTGEAYLRYGTLKKLCAVQEDLAKKGFRLRVWAAYRPFPVQVEMFRLVGGNGNWVSDPFRSTGKKTHVRGAAVDCTLLDSRGIPVAMPTEYLDFEGGSERMKHSFQDLPEEVLANRRLLKQTMLDHGMEPYAGEWWHYQDSDWKRYPIIGFGDFPEVHRRILAPDLYESFKKLSSREEPSPGSPKKTD